MNQATDTHSRGIGNYGPAWIVSAVACGPATLTSLAIAGGAFGYQLFWVVIASALFAFVAQFLGAKAGIIGGQGIIATVRQVWGRRLAWILAINALAVTWLAAIALMNALVGVSGMITGLHTRWWAVLWAVLLFVLVGLGGYRLLETVSKALVAAMVGCFLVTVLVARPDLSQMVGGMVPRLAGGRSVALTAAGITGGAVHITIIAMHSYTVNARGWGTAELEVARRDTFGSMVIAFGLYSIGIFLAAAAVLHPAGIRIGNIFELSATLRPLLGRYAAAVFSAGLFGAVISTIGPTVLAGGYFLADAARWPLDTGDRRFRLAVAAGCLVSAAGAFLGGNIAVTLMVMLALGLCGTPFILVLLMVLLNKRSWAGSHRNRTALNVAGGAVIVLTCVLALRFVLTHSGVAG